MNTTLQVRMPKKLKEDTEKVFQSLGLDGSTVIRMFYTQISRTHRIPLSLEERDENGLTAAERADLDDALAHPEDITGTFDTAEDLIQHLHTL